MRAEVGDQRQAVARHCPLRKLNTAAASSAEKNSVVVVVVVVVVHRQKFRKQKAAGHIQLMADHRVLVPLLAAAAAAAIRIAAEEPRQVDKWDRLGRGMPAGTRGAARRRHWAEQSAAAAVSRL